MPDEDNNSGGSLVSDFKKMMTSRATQELIKGMLNWYEFDLPRECKNI